MQATAFATLNFQQPNFVTVYAAQNNRLTRFVNISLLDGSTAWTPPAGALLTIKYCRADGVGGFYDTLEDDSPAGVINADGTVTIGLAEQLLAVAGHAAAELSFYSAAGEKLSTARFCVNVQPSAWADDEIVSSEPYLNVLSQQIAAVLEAAADLTGLTVSATTGAAGSSATATVTGGSDGQPYKIAFRIPRGNTGATPNISIGTVETVASSAQAEATITGTAAAPKLNLKIPRGVDGTGAVSSVMGVSPGSTTHDVPAAQLFNLIYPVGAIYISTSPTDPATLFGGSWTRIEDRFLLAAGSAYAAGATGGAASQSVDGENFQANVGFSDAYTKALYLERAEINEKTFLAANKAPSSGSLQWTGAASETIDAAKVEGTQSIDILPPYLAVYVWQRTELAS